MSGRRDAATRGAGGGVRARGGARAASYSYRYPRPAVTVDCVVLGLDGPALKVLLIRRDRPPFEGRWALPGGFVDEDEPLEAAARRELREETGLDGVALEQLQTFGAIDRDPRDRVISVVHWALVRGAEHPARAADDARDAAWLPAARISGLAFDHDAILALALRRLRERAACRPLGLGLLPPRFPLADLRGLYEAILDRPLDARRFRRHALALGVLVPVGRARPGGLELYRFDRRAYARRVEEGPRLPA